MENAKLGNKPILRDDLNDDPGTANISTHVSQILDLIDKQNTPANTALTILAEAAGRTILTYSTSPRHAERIAEMFSFSLHLIIAAILKRKESSNV